MKKWTFLVATALMAGATPVLTGCIDNEEPEGITILRGAKAELLKAKAAVEAAKVAQVEAEAAYMLAQAEVQKALAASEQAKAKILEAQAKQEEAKAKLLETQNEAAIAALQEQIKEYERIQKEWEAKMAAEATKAEQALAEWELQYKQMEIAYQQALIELATAKATLTQKQQGILAPYVAELQAKKDIYDEKAEAVRLAQRAVLEATQEVETNEADKEYYQRELQWALKAAQYAKEGADKALERANAELAEFQGMEPSALQQKKAALEAELQELGKTIADMSVAAAEEVRKMEEGEIAQYNDALQKNNDNYINKEYTLKEFTYTVGEGLPTAHFGEYTLEEQTYTLASAWMYYDSRKAELENLYQQFVSWTRDENDNAWTNERIAKLEDDLKKNEEAVAKLKASWKEAVDAYHKDPATVVADPSVITGYTELCAAVDAYNTVATSLNEKNATMQTIRQAMSDAWAAYYKAETEAWEEYWNTDWNAINEANSADYDALWKAYQDAVAANDGTEEKQEAVDKAYEAWMNFDWNARAEAIEKKRDDAIAAAEKTRNEILTAKKAEEITAQEAIDTESNKLDEVTTAAIEAYNDFTYNAGKSDNPSYSIIFNVMANSVDIYNISNDDEIKGIEYNEVGWTGFGHWYRTPSTLDKSTLTELNKDALTKVIIYRSNALYGTSIYNTNAYGDFDARLIELTIDDIKAELAKEEDLIGENYISACYNYGLVGESLAIQTRIDLAKAWLSNDSQVKALIDQTKAAIDEMTAEYEAAVEAHETEVERLEGVRSDIEDKLQASIDEINKKRAELQPIQHLLNAVVHAIEDYKANGSTEYSQEDIDYAIATLEKKVKDIEKQVYDAETAVMTAQRNLEGWNNGSLDKLAIAKNNLEDAEAALAVAKENMEAAQAALTSVIEALATDSATTENL